MKAESWVSKTRNQQEEFRKIWAGWRHYALEIERGQIYEDNKYTTLPPIKGGGGRKRGKGNRKWDNVVISFHASKK